MRDPRANYLQTLSVLRAAKACGVYTKSSIMLGLGETGECVCVCEVVLTRKELCVCVKGGGVELGVLLVSLL